MKWDERFKLLKKCLNVNTIEIDLNIVMHVYFNGAHIHSKNQNNARTGSVPCDREEWGRGPQSGPPSATSAFIRLAAQEAVDAIWL